jgi:hypothetical protein
MWDVFLQRFVLIVLICILLLLSVDSGFAATFGDMFTAIKGSVERFGDLIKLVFPVAGAVCIGVGVLKFIQNNPHDTFFDKAIWILVGGALLAFAAFAAASSESLGLSTGGSGLNF